MFEKIKTITWNNRYILLFISLFIIVLTQRFLSEKQQGLVKSIASDGTGYYCYLPAAIIYQDFSYDFYNKRENCIKPTYQPDITKYNDRGVNKYYCGTAFCLLPFFIIGILISLVAGTDLNGYTDTFLMLVSIAPIVYYLLSVFFISRIAKFFSISEKLSFLTCLIFLFGTNYYHYIIQEPSMSHAYSFFAVSLFLYLFVRLIKDISLVNLIFLGLSLALVYLVRPVNIVIILFTPFFFDNFKCYFHFLKRLILNHLFGVLSFIISFLFSISIQFIFYYFQTGDFFVVPYAGETFNFLKPEFFNVLLSYKKGLFIYVPILLSTIVFILLTKNNWYRKIIFFITFLFFLYVTASWWCWSYGGGLSIRPMIDMLPIFIIISILLVDQLSPFRKKIVFFSAIPFVMYGQLVSFQYANFLIDASLMDKNKFWDVFLETDTYSVYENKRERILKNRKIVKTVLLNFEDMELDNLIVNGGYKSNKACITGKLNNYSKSLSVSANDISLGKPFYLVVEGMVKVQEGDKMIGLVAAETRNNNMVGWHVVFACQFNEDKNGWMKLVNIIEVDENFKNENGVINILMNSQTGQYLIDDIKYEIIE